MAYVAIKNFDGYSIGDKIKKADVSDRLIRAKKIAEGKDPKKEKVEKPKKIEEVKEEILTEVSSEVTFKVETEEKTEEKKDGFFKKILG